MSTLVMKFGGSSVGSAEALRQAVAIVVDRAAEWDRLAVVVSAMSGVTDNLIGCAQSAEVGNEEVYRAIAGELRSRHRSVVEELVEDVAERERLAATIDGFIHDLEALCDSISILGEVTPRAMDAIASLGERLSARVMAALARGSGLRAEAVDGTEVIVTDAKYQNAAPLMDETRARVAERLVPLLDDGVVPVVTGFIGATQKGITATLGRGGSDYTAAILGDCLDADEVWTWTDVDGVMTADPRMVPDAQVIPVLSYSEVSELAYFGAKVLHPKTILPVVRRGIPLWVKNTFNPSHEGTRIMDSKGNTHGRIKAVTAIEGLSMVTVEGRGMMGVPGIAARTFAAVASQGTSVLMISQASSEQSICFVIPTAGVAAVIAALEREMAGELARRDIDRIWSMDDVVIVTAVGAGLRSTPGIAARVFSALGEGGINVVAIAQGSSECNLSLVVSEGDAAGAVRQIHDQVILNGGQHRR
jgi:aspartokinase/homoserine dehydrogenase 1